MNLFFWNGIRRIFGQFKKCFVDRIDEIIRRRGEAPFCGREEQRQLVHKIIPICAPITPITSNSSAKPPNNLSFRLNP